jgi:predicted O-linked N-acetylglucosamine transferase (SPINDLY family)
MPEMTLPQAFELAVQHHQAGRLQEAESIYRQILAVQPWHADTLHHLGIMAHQVGKNEMAVDLIRQAIGLQSNSPNAYCNLGNALTDLGLFDEAIAACRQAITLRPSLAEAHYNLANALDKKGQAEDAIAAYRRAIALQPAYADALNNLGNALRGTGQIEEAIAVCRRALVLRPDYPEALNNLGAALYDEGQGEEAMAAYRQAIALRPDFAEAYNNLGLALRGAGRLEEAIGAYRQVITLKPRDHEAFNKLGVALFDKGQFEEAIAVCRQAIALKPDFPDAHSNLAAVLGLGGRYEEAIAACRQAIALRPDCPEAYSNLGNTLQDQGRLDEALAAYREAIALKPTLADAHSNLLFCMNYHPGLEPSAIAEEHRRWARQHGEPLRPFIQPHSNDRAPGRRLRIGYVSPDFRDHSVAYFFEGLLAHHDPAQMEVFCYAEVANPDAVTARLQRTAGHWRNTSGIADAQVAELIRRDGIDILVDLAGHSAKNRLLVFARKPAPVQLTWLGYPNTTGLATMDYRLTDAFADPPGTGEDLSSERLVRLARSGWCYRPSDEVPPVSAPPHEAKGHITFGCFNAMPKLNEPLLELWAKILLAVPGSRLLLKNRAVGEAAAERRWKAGFAAAGISPERVGGVGHVADKTAHLACYGRVDIALDTFPYHGTTTTCEALWMSVPVVTRAGQTHASRVGVSLLSNVGHPEWIADSPEGYVRIAVELAGDLPRLAGLRATLRGRMQASPLTDAPGFARDIEAAYRTMWRTWCEQPESPSCPK